MNRLRDIRKKHKLSLRELDEKVNINYSQLARIEKSEASLTNQHIQVLTSFFGVSADYLLGLSDIPNPKPHKYLYATINDMLTIEDIIDKYQHQNISIVFAPTFIKVRFDNDPTKDEIVYRRIK